MKALTILQPWASLITHGDKRVENRTWRPPAAVIGTRIAIHAGARWDNSFPERHQRYAEEVLRKVYEGAGAFPTKAIVGTAVLARVAASREELGQGDRAARWFAGPFGWVLEDVVALPSPIQIPGAQGLWTVPQQILSALEVLR